MERVTLTNILITNYLDFLVCCFLHNYLKTGIYEVFQILIGPLIEFRAGQIINFCRAAI